MAIGGFHLAQVNVARMRATFDDPLMEGFRSQLEPINAVADQSPGFVWRLQTSAGDATEMRVFADERILVNMSAIGSDTGICLTLLPTRLCDAREQTCVCHLSQAASAQSEIAVIASRPSANSAAIMQANLRKLAFSNKQLVLVLFYNHRCFGHDPLLKWIS